MTDLVLEDLEPDLTPSEAIAAVIRRAIADGRLQPGDRLPAQTALTEHYGVARETVRSALRILDQDWLIDRRQGARVTVRASEDAPSLATLRGELTELHRALQRSRTELETAEHHVSTALTGLSQYSPK